MRTGDPGASERGETCSVCGQQMREVHCKITCPRCGYSRDCSDP